ncbi:MAG TPA: MAPEG family protein [Rhizomicrobium sp.]|nr:MAPEG family protein [Rhizomicrobium sp.]
MLLPVTTATASVLGIFFVLLSIAVSGERYRAKVGLGVGNDTSAAFGQEHTASRLLIAVRRHGHFAEFVPLSLILMLLLELGGTARTTMISLAAALIVSRLMIIAGIGRAAPNLLRAGGNLLQQLMIVTACIVGLIAAYKDLA